jgi:hypothetical protein
LKAAGVKQIDHMWTTHYHGQFPIMHFYDHGKPHPNDRIVSAAFEPSILATSRGTLNLI